MKRVYANASIVGENRIVFNVGGSKYRLVVAVNYRYRMCYVRFIGTHKAYDRRRDGVRCSMQIRPIKAKADHRAALKEIERLMDAKPGTPAGDRLEILITLLDHYESQTSR